MSLFATIIVFSMLWTVIWNILLKDQTLKLDTYSNDELTFQHSLFIFLALFFQKPSPYEPMSISMRILLGTIAYLAMVNFTSYSANLISAQMTAKVDFPFDSYHSFYYKTNYKFGQVSATVFDEIFQVDLPKYKKLMTNMKYNFSNSFRMAQSCREECMQRDGKIFQILKL